MNVLIPSEKDSLDGSRCFRSFFTLRMFLQSFLLTNFTIVLSFSLSRWHACMSRLLMFTPISPKTLYTFFAHILHSSKSWSLIDEGIPITSIVSRRECWAFTQHCFSVRTTLSMSFEFKFFVTAKSVSSFLKYANRSFA